MKVSKFGGTSLANSAQIKKVAQAIISDPSRKIVVVSAPGKVNERDVKITDLIINCTNAFYYDRDYRSILQKIFDKFRLITNELDISEIMPEIESSFLERMTRSIAYNSLMDSLKALGEDNCAKIVATYLRKIGYRAQYIDPFKAGMFLSNHMGNATILDETYQNLSSLANIDYIGIFPGFFGFTKNKDIVTFPRGGSDITGALIAAAVNADLYENFTDVDYVYTVNPNIIKNAKPIYSMSYLEMRELSYSGFNVYQEEALFPLYKANIRVNIRNINNMSCSGTMLLSHIDKRDNPVTGIACRNGFISINIRKFMMNRQVGFVRRILALFEEEGISLEHVPSGIDNISVIVREEEETECRLVQLCNKITMLFEPDSMSIEKNISLIAVVGENLLNNIGIAARATNAISNKNINIKMIIQGASEVSIIFAVQSEHMEQTVCALYDEFF